MEILELLAKAILEHGMLGILALAGWSLAGWFLYRDNKKKERINLALKEKDDTIKHKDEEINGTKDKIAQVIQDLSEKRLNDLKEVTEDYNKVATDVIHTLDKLMTALEVRSSHIGRD